MSRPILSRPRTRVYGCNYDKGESYYKPMVDHLDRKYSSRPLFSEPRTSFADEIAARRSDIGSRNLSEPKIDAEDDLEFVFNGLGRAIPDEDIEDDFVSSQRRFKQRAANAFEEDLADLRRKRRDIQDRMFDMIDIGAEINRAKSTLATSNKAFEKHAMKFDNKDEPEIEPKNLVERLEKARKLKKLQLVQEQPEIEGKIKTPMMKWCTFVELDNEMPKLVGEMTKARIRSEAPMNVDGTPIVDKSKCQPTEKRRTKKRSTLKKKKLLAL